MEKKSFFKRSVIPATIVLHVMIFSGIVYLRLAWRMEAGGSFRAIITWTSSFLLFISIGFGALYIYPRSFFGGAGTAERVAACFVTPLVWNLKEMIRVSEFFSFGETLYYGLNTSALLAFFGTLGLMGLSEILCRRKLAKTSSEPVKILTPAPIAAIVTGLTVFFICWVWGMGVHFFYIYIQGYRALFT
jgi:hypothetical protein